MTYRYTKLTVENFFASCSDAYNLQWVAGKKGGAKLILPETVKEHHAQAATAKKRREPQRMESRSLIGHLSLIYPHQIQIVGGTALKFLRGLDQVHRKNTLDRLFAAEPSCIIISHNNRIPAFLKHSCDEHGVALLRSSIATHTLTDLLHHHLSSLFTDVLTLHGVYLEIHTIGVLLTGPSGVGKSEVALELITRGHRLVADDTPQFARLPSGKINGTCPPMLQDFLEVRGMGVINVRKLFGDISIKPDKELDLIVKLEPSGKKTLRHINRLTGSYKMQNVLDIDIPTIMLPVALGRNLAVLLECAVRNHILGTSGYDAPEEFSKQQRHMIKLNEHETKS